MPVYLIHFRTPLAHARHYVGFAESMRTLKERLAHHQNGSGANLMKVVSAAGIQWDVVKVWEDGDRSFERRIKNQHHSWKHCFICRAERGLAEEGHGNGHKKGK